MIVLIPISGLPDVWASSFSSSNVVIHQVAVNKLEEEVEKDSDCVIRISRVAAAHGAAMTRTLVSKDSELLLLSDPDQISYYSRALGRRDETAVLIEKPDLFACQRP